MKKNIKEARQEIAFNVIAILVLTVVSLFCLIPFLLMVSGSFTSESAITKYGFQLIPREVSLEAYKAVFLYPDAVLKAYLVTVVNTIVGTLLGLFLISMTGYVLSRRDFLYRNKISFFIYFTTLFGGGLVPFYIVYMRVLNLGDNYMAICLPSLMSPYLIILMRTFIKATVPEEIIESSKIDGAGNFTTYLKVVLPVIKPGLATVGLFLALGYWNGWFFSSLFITTPEKFELQYFLYKVLNGLQAAQMLASKGANVTIQIPGESIKLAMAVIVTGPVLFFYPFIQRYFVSGITIGAVKG